MGGANKVRVSVPVHDSSPVFGISSPIQVPIFNLSDESSLLQYNITHAVVPESDTYTGL